MTKFELLDSLVMRGNGYLLTSAVTEAGISKPTLAAYVKARQMERVAKGLYLAKDAWPDSLYVFSVQSGRILYSHETALYLHGLMEREPTVTTVSVPAGYNASHLRRRQLSVHQVSPDTYLLGASSVRTGFGNLVPVYDVDRTICDIVKCKDQMDIQVFQTAMKEYMTGSQKNPNRLIDYAHALKIERMVRTYTEVML